MNFFYCKTVFQVYFASELIKRKNIRNVFFLYMPNGPLSNKEKAILDELIVNYEVISSDNSLFRFIKQALFLFKLKRKEYESNIYFSSIDDLYLKTIISRVKFKLFYTFDDGTANYLTKSMYYIDKKHSKYIGYKYYLLGNRIKTLDEVKNKINKHYSVSKFKNIIDNCEYIPLFNIVIKNKPTRLVRIFICPYFEEFYEDPIAARANMENLILKGDIIFYHPRDKKMIKASKNTSLITEEYIKQLLLEGCYIKLFGVANSTQFNFAFIENVENIILQLGKVKPDFVEVFNEQAIMLNSINK